MSLRFGTDGVRGRAEEFDDEFVSALGQAAAELLGSDRFVVARDPRESGSRLQRALVRGLTLGGAAVTDLGMAPTPAVAWNAAATGAAGAMVSASHNAFHDNGIKFFGVGGRKLADDVESGVERRVSELWSADRRPVHRDVATNPGPANISNGASAADASIAANGPADLAALGRWVDAVEASVEGRRFDGLRLVVDCANGAASIVGPEVLRRLGVDLVVLHATPDGRNINERCGSTYPDDLRAAVVAERAAFGICFDGDADRLLAVDETGELVDGDQLLAMHAVDLRDRGRLAHETVVVTVMTNLGFRLAMTDHGINVVDTKVGDRYVLEALDRGRFSLGGEQSGHLIFHDLATTGDGLLAGVQLLDLVVRSGTALSKLASVMTRLPQELVNVRVATRGTDGVALIRDELLVAERDLGASGRVLVRSSGTEPLVRVMVEAPTATEAHDVAHRLAALVAERAPAG